jgi:iron complex transport system substrate-binding protein
MKDAKANYLWADVEGTGSLSLSFEKYWKKAKLPNTGLQQVLLI